MRLAAVAALIVLPACALALGVQHDPTVAISQLCFCTNQITPRMVPEGCQDTLTTRLELAPAAERAAWLQTYAEKCTNCAGAATCFYQPPTCVGAMNACTHAEECCSFHSTSNPKACTGGICQ